MSTLLIVLLVLLAIGALGGGFYTNPAGATPYRTGGWSIGGILIIILVVLLLTGRIA